MSEKDCDCPKNNDGGYIVCKKCLPEVQRQAIVFANKMLAMFAFRLLCESDIDDD